MKKMEQFKNNLEGQGFSKDFVQKSLQYFKELEEEKEVQEMATVEEVIQYYDKINSYTCDILQSEENLINFRKDILKLFYCDNNNILDFNIYFENIEDFEIQILYVLYYEFYRNEEEEEK